MVVGTVCCCIVMLLNLCACLLDPTLNSSTSYFTILSFLHLFQVEAVNLVVYTAHSQHHHHHPARLLRNPWCPRRRRMPPSAICSHGTRSCPVCRISQMRSFTALSTPLPSRKRRAEIIPCSLTWGSPLRSSEVSSHCHLSHPA